MSILLLNVKQETKYLFFGVFCLTQPGIEPCRPFQWQTVYPLDHLLLVLE